LKSEKNREAAMCRIYSTVLMVGIKDKTHGLQELPLRLLVMDTGKQALKCLREESIDSVISRWDLLDMPNGLLFQRILAARPKMPTVALIESGNTEQEILARSLGVTAVITDDAEGEYLRRLICQILHLEDGVALHAAAADEFD